MVELVKTQVASEWRIKDAVDYLCLFLAKIVLDVTYAYCISPNPRFVLYNFKMEFSIFWIVASWSIYLVFSLMLLVVVKKMQKWSSIIVSAFFVLAFLPGTTIIEFYGVTPNFALSWLLYWLVFLVAAGLLPSIKLKGKTNTKVRKWFLYGIVAVLVVVILFISWKYTGFRISLDISSTAVYAQRMEARDYDAPTLLVYGFGIAKTLIPVLVVAFLNGKRYFTAAALAFVQILAFSVDASKSTLAYLIIGIVCFCIVRKATATLVIRILTALLCVCLCVFFLFGMQEGVNYFSRRVMMVPAVLNCEYFDFFSSHEFDYYRQSVLSKIGFASPYQESISRIIGPLYHNSPSMSANNGLYADAYANLGLPGCVVMPVVLAIVFRVLDALSLGIADSTMMIACVITVSVMGGSSFFTAFLTHGIFFLGLVVFLLPIEESKIASDILYGFKRMFHKVN